MKMVEIGDIGTWFSIIVFIFLAVFSYINREGFRRGSVKGQGEVTTTVLANTIKELEGAKKIMEDLSDKIDEQRGLIIRLEERLRFTCREINELKQRLGMPQVRFEDNGEYKP